MKLHIPGSGKRSSSASASSNCGDSSAFSVSEMLWNARKRASKLIETLVSKMRRLILLLVMLLRPLDGHMQPWYRVDFYTDGASSWRLGRALSAAG